MTNKKKYVVKEIKSENENEFLYRASFLIGKEALEWLNQYQEESKTQWIVDKTFPNPERYSYRHIWRCQLSSKHKTGNSQRNLQCPAKLDIKIKKVTKDTKKKDPWIGKHDPPLPAILTVTNNHNHYLDRCDSMRYLRGDEELRKTFYSYFSEGHPVHVARSIHYDKIREMENGSELIADGHKNPSKHTAYWWYSEWRAEHFGDPLEPLVTLEKKIDAYEKDGAKVVIKKESPWVVLVSTPIMVRAQSLSSAGEITFVDTTSTCNASHSNVTPILTATKVGAIPLSVLIHESQTEECYKDAFSLLHDELPTCFGGKESPDVFMTDNSTAEKNALSAVFPDAEQLLCHFHVGQQEWRFLTEKKNGIDVSERQELMRAFQKIMYSVNTEEFHDMVEEFKKIPQQAYRERIEKFLERKREWVKLFRMELLMRGHHTNNLAEATMRILKDIILERVKAFNVVALVDYIVYVWDRYLERKILNISHKLDNRPTLLYESLLKKMKPDLADKIEQVDEDIFIVPSAQTGALTYEVNRSIGVCLCPAGASGAFCKHQALVHSKFGGAFPNAPPITSQDRYQLGQLALGDKCPRPEFFLETLQNADDISEEDKNEIVTNFMEEWKRIHEVAKEEQGYFKYLKTATRMMGKLRSSTSATGAALKLSAALRQHTGRRGKIKIQGTSIQRRSEGSSRSNSRIPAGRRPKKRSNVDEVQPTRGCGRTAVGRPNKNSAHKPKRRHVLAQSVKTNVPHVRKHT